MNSKIRKTREQRAFLRPGRNESQTPPTDQVGSCLIFSKCWIVVSRSRKIARDVRVFHDILGPKAEHGFSQHDVNII